MSIKVSTKELTNIQVADDDSILAVGSRDSNIYIYSVIGLKKVAICKGHHSTVRHFDFAKNNRTLQSTCTSYEILYWDARIGKQDTKGATNNKDEIWNNWSCTLGWPV
jgi:WD40 repeat protein